MASKCKSGVLSDIASGRAVLGMFCRIFLNNKMLTISDLFLEKAFRGDSLICIFAAE